MASKLRRALGAIVYAVVLTCVVFGLLARHVDPATAWWLQLFAIVLPYAGVALLLATPLVFVAGGAVRSFLHVVLLLFLATRFIVLDRLSDEEIQPGDLRVLSLNVPSFAGVDADRSAAVKDLILRLDPHVVCLQETALRYRSNGDVSAGVLGADFAVDLVDSLGFATRGPVNSRRFVVTPVLVKGRVDSADAFDIGSSDDVTLAASVTRAEVWVDGRSIVVYNVHLRSFGPDKPWEDDGARWYHPGFWRKYLGLYRGAILDRAMQSGQVADMIARETGPLIVAGDLNATPHNWSYWRIARGLRDSFDREGRGWGATYHSNLPFARIDFVMANDHFDIVDARTQGVAGSDHRAVTAVLRLSEPSLD